jgi:16S rRNA (guanine966-N2)-methyltransferase
MPKKSSNSVRIIGGKLRRHLITFPHAIGLRPTPDRVRETLFNWLGQDLTGKMCLDLFAGSGALGFEAASRYAKRVVMVEMAKPVYLQLHQNRARLQLQSTVELHHQSALSYLAQNSTPFDLIFLDPPFASDLLVQILPLLAPHVAEEGVIYIEAAQPPTLPVGHWLKQGKAGEVHFGLATLTS